MYSLKGAGRGKFSNQTLSSIEWEKTHELKLFEGKFATGIEGPKLFHEQGARMLVRVLAYHFGHFANCYHHFLFVTAIVFGTATIC